MELPETVVLDTRILAQCAHRETFMQYINTANHSPVCSQYHALKTLFPDVSCELLWQKCVELNGNTTLLQRFVSELLENRNNEKDTKSLNVPTAECSNGFLSPEDDFFGNSSVLSEVVELDYINNESNDSASVSFASKSDIASINESNSMPSVNALENSAGLDCLKESVITEDESVVTEEESVITEDENQPELTEGNIHCELGEDKGQQILTDNECAELVLNSSQESFENVGNPLIAEDNSNQTQVFDNSDEVEILELDGLESNNTGTDNKVVTECLCDDNTPETSYELTEESLSAFGNSTDGDTSAEIDVVGLTNDAEDNEDFFDAVVADSTNEESFEEASSEDIFDDGAIARAIAEEEEYNLAQARVKDPLEETFELALNIIPDADPEYLKFKCEEIGGDMAKLETLIQDALDREDYPKFDNYLIYKKAVNDEVVTLNNISIPSFVEMFPEPEPQLFSSQEISREEVDAGLAYLQRRYRMITTGELNRIYATYEYDLYKTCQEFDKWNGHLRDKPRGDWDCTPPSGNSKHLLYKIYFIEKEKQIREYMELERQRRENAQLIEPKLECPICCNDELAIEEMSCCADAHLFCKDCIKRHVEVKIGEGLTKFPCLDNTCGAEFHMRTLQPLLNPTLFLRTVQRIAGDEIRAADIKHLEMCPFCEYMAILPPDNAIFECQNPDCQKVSCRFCKELDHTPLQCHQVEKEGETKMRTEIEDKMTEALVRVCDSCKKKFVKLDGCNKMTCVCGNIMCYLCRKTVTDYSHFNGMGGTEYHKCPLFSNDALIHREEVKVAAERAKAEVVARNPEMVLKNDPTLYLP